MRIVEDAEIHSASSDPHQELSCLPRKSRQAPSAAHATSGQGTSTLGFGGSSPHRKLITSILAEQPTWGLSRGNASHHENRHFAGDTEDADFL